MTVQKSIRRPRRSQRPRRSSRPRRSKRPRRSSRPRRPRRSSRPRRSQRSRRTRRPRRSSRPRRSRRTRRTRRPRRSQKISDNELELIGGLLNISGGLFGKKTLTNGCYKKSRWFPCGFGFKNIDGQCCERKRGRIRQFLDDHGPDLSFIMVLIFAGVLFCLQVPNSCKTLFTTILAYLQDIWKKKAAEGHKGIQTVKDEAEKKIAEAKVKGLQIAQENLNSTKDEMVEKGKKMIAIDLFDRLSDIPGFPRGVSTEDFKGILDEKGEIKEKIKLFQDLISNTASQKMKSFSDGILKHVPGFGAPEDEIQEGVGNFSDESIMNPLHSQLSEEQIGERLRESAAASAADSLFEEDGDGDGANLFPY